MLAATLPSEPLVVEFRVRAHVASPEAAHCLAQQLFARADGALATSRGAQVEYAVPSEDGKVAHFGFPHALPPGLADLLDASLEHVPLSRAARRLAERSGLTAYDFRRLRRARNGAPYSIEDVEALVSRL